MASPPAIAASSHRDARPRACSCRRPSCPVAWSTGQSAATAPLAHAGRCQGAAHRAARYRPCVIEWPRCRSWTREASGQPVVHARRWEEASPLVGRQVDLPRWCAQLESTTAPRSEKAWLAGLFQCARMDSNHHGEISPQGPQPCASTNSATGAEWASIALATGGEGGSAERNLHPSCGGATVRTHVRFRPQSNRSGSPETWI